ncbi:hypothetical protein G6F22_016626 [Rhizopus arrhizus]|nr:hypothetical protein G6F22_016626 [Rhizopus arrhizus]
MDLLLADLLLKIAATITTSPSRRGGTCAQACQFDAIAAQRLRAVQRMVCRGKAGGQRRHVAVELRQADADGGRYPHAPRGIHHRLGKTPDDGFGQQVGAARGVARQQARELFAADPGQHGGRADRALRHVRKRGQDLVARFVAVQVVDRFEMVKVERKHGNGALPGRAADDARALLEEPSAVAQACQIVGQGFLQQLAMRFFADQLDQRHGQND